MARRTSSSAATTLAPVIEGEHRARKCGRLFAKQIFQTPQQWKVIGTHPGDHVEIFEEVPSSSSAAHDGTIAHGPGSSSSATRSFRAVRKLYGAIDDMEEIFSATHRSQLYAKLLPELYASGGCITDYGLVKHATDEREHTNVQFALHRPHFWSQTASNTNTNGPLDHHVLLEYTLATHLQRTHVVTLPDGTSKTSTKPVPSLLYVLRPVVVPSFSDRHAEFEPEKLARHQFSVTYIIQQEEPTTTTKDQQLSIEVVLSCVFPFELEQRASMRASNTSEMWRMVVALTRLQPLLDAVRLANEQERRRTSPAMAPSQMAMEMPSRRTEVLRSTPAPGTGERASTRIKMKELFTTAKDKRRKNSSAAAAGGQSDTDDEEDLHLTAMMTSGGCAACHKKFHAFRWKKRCEVCLQGVCDTCLSTITNPKAMKKKKRVCSACLYGGTNSGFDRITGAADFSKDADRAMAAVRMRARTDAAPAAAAAIAGTADRSSRRYTSAKPPPPQEASSSSATRRRAQTQASTAAAAMRPPPPPAPPVVVFPMANGTPVTPTAASSSWASEEQSTCTNPDEMDALIQIDGLVNLTDANNFDDALLPPYKNNSFFDETDPSGTVSDDEFTAVTTRSRRAQTIEIGDVAIKHVERKKRSARAGSSTTIPAMDMNCLTTASDKHTSNAAAAARARRRSFSNDRSDIKPFDFSGFTLPKRETTTGATTKAKAGAAASLMAKKRSAMQFRQLKTPAITYELDFDWLHPFPKAPIPRGATETSRVELMATQLKLNAHTAMVYLRRDNVLEELTQHVVGSLATQWDGCSIHLIGARQVFCLAYSYQEPLPVDVASIDVVTDDVVSREESASSYALFHHSAFFVPDLSDDVRFRAHPIHTEARVASYLSLPIYASHGSRSCIGTLDLWRLDPIGVSSHVSHDWWTKMERVLDQVAARIEELSLAHAGHTSHTSPSFQKDTRPQKARSVGSSCDSRGSTRKADSFEIDLRDLMEEHVLVDDEAAENGADADVDEDEEEDSDVDVEYELDVDGWMSSPATPAAPVGVSALAVTPATPVAAAAPTTRMRRHTASDQYDAAGRLSSGSASSDLESTIESLLYQAKRTSEYVRQSRAC